MVILQYLLLALEVVVSLMLLLVILVQRTKSGGGMGAAMGGGFGESVFGSRAGNVLTKATVVLSTVFLLNTLGLAVIYSKGRAADNLMTSAPADLPAMPADTGTAPEEPAGPAPEPATAP